MILPVDSLDLSSYSVSELLRLRDRVNELLPSADIEDISLAEELVRTFQKASGLLDEALGSDDTPLSQKASIVSAINSVLKQLKDSQKEIYDIQRQQKLESALVEALKRHPEIQQSFFDIYEQG